jgi:hypothetical protein
MSRFLQREGCGSPTTRKFEQNLWRGLNK